MSRRDDLDEFYRLLGELRQRVGGYRLLHDCHGKSGWPERGIYFFFEDGEFREDGVTPRVVRVGTHAISKDSKTKLWTRLRTHRGSRKGGGNHRSSIFRLRVGEALQQRTEAAKDIRESWSQRRKAPKHVRLAEVSLELDVSEHICRMPFLWMAVDDAPSIQSKRAELERNSIAILSNFRKSPLDPPSSKWLGSCSPEQTIRDSGLWNTDYVDGQYNPVFLSTFCHFIRCSKVRLS
jgi:hypothetical protein